MSEPNQVNQDASALEAAQLIRARLSEEKQRIRAELERIERELQAQIAKANQQDGVANANS